MRAPSRTATPGALAAIMRKRSCAVVIVASGAIGAMPSRRLRPCRQEHLHDAADQEVMLCSRAIGRAACRCLRAAPRTGFSRAWRQHLRHLGEGHHARLPQAVRAPPPRLPAAFCVSLAHRRGGYAFEAARGDQLFHCRPRTGQPARLALDLAHHRGRPRSPPPPSRPLIHPPPCLQHWISFPVRRHQSIPKYIVTLDYTGSKYTLHSNEWQSSRTQSEARRLGVSAGDGLC